MNPIRKVEPILKNLTINNKNQIIGIDDHVVYAEIDDVFDWCFFYKKSGKPDKIHPEQIESVELNQGLVTITFKTGRQPLQFTKKGKIKPTDAVENPQIIEETPVEIEPLPIDEETPVEPLPYPDIPTNTTVSEPLNKGLVELTQIIETRLNFVHNDTFKIQYDLFDTDGYCYAHYDSKNDSLHFEKWNGNYPKNGKIVAVPDDLENIALTDDIERTIKVSWKDGRTGYFLGDIPKVADDQYNVVFELQYPPRRMDVDMILKKYYQGRLLLRDFKPSIKVNGGWVEYSASKHERKLLSESDEAVRQFYMSRLTQSEFQKYKYQIPKSEFPDILGMLFNEEQQDTFLEWVKSVPWDGIDRKSTLHKAIGLSSTPFNEQPVVGPDDDDHYCKAIVHMLLVGAIQRHIKPFTQDFIPVIVGLQGSGKSTTLKALGGSFDDDVQGWYCGFTGSINPDNNGREFFRPQLGKAVVELVEIDHVLKKDTTGLIKGFLSNSHARFNEKHEKGMKEYPLTAFITGTTNYERFLIDNTGNRRFLIVYMTQQEDTPKRESLKETDLFGYTNAPLYLKFHPEYVQQLYAQAYQELQNNELYDFYVDRDDPKNIVLNVQSKLNLLALKEPEYMDLLVGYMRSKCEENYYNVCNWVDIRTGFMNENKELMTKFQFETLFKSFRENPKRFGFSDYGTFRITNEKTVKGFRLIDSEINENFTRNYSELVD